MESGTPVLRKGRQGTSTFFFSRCSALYAAEDGNAEAPRTHYRRICRDLSYPRIVCSESRKRASCKSIRAFLKKLWHPVQQYKPFWNTMRPTTRCTARKPLQQPCAVQDSIQNQRSFEESRRFTRTIITNQYLTLGCLRIPCQIQKRFI